MDRAIDYGRFDPETEILLSPRGKPIHPSNFYRVWRPALDSVELAYRWHDLRHTCVSRLVAARARTWPSSRPSPATSDPRITLQRYTHLREARVTQAAERFASVFSR